MSRMLLYLKHILSPFMLFESARSALPILSDRLNGMNDHYYKGGFWI